MWIKTIRNKNICFDKYMVILGYLALLEIV